jgi:phage shock protein E
MINRRLPVLDSQSQKCASMPMRDARIELDKNKDIILIDVRSPEEYRRGHIAGSRNIPVDRIPLELIKTVPDKKMRIFVYCLSGARSEQACAWMTGNGYQAVINIGGISSWNGPVAKG